MSRGPDAATLLARALVRSAAGAGASLSVTQADWTRWASATFNGARHLLTLEGFRCPALERWCDGLPEAELPLNGHLVADLSVEHIRREGGRMTIMLEVLTVEAR